MLEHFLQIAEPWLEHYGYAALFGAMFLEGIGIPAPGLTFLLASALLASRKEMLMAPVVGSALAGYVGGCQVAFLIGRTGGRRLMLRIGLLNRHRLRRLRRLFARWGAPLLVAAPFLDGTRQYSALVAGTADTGWQRFSLFNLAGSVLWIGIWCAATEMFGHDIEPVLRFVHGSASCLLGVVLTVIVAMLVYQLARRHSAS